MGTDNGKPGGPDEHHPREFIQALYEEAKILIRQALREGRPSDAAALYHGNVNDTEAAAAAVLSAAWQSFVAHSDGESDLPELVSMPELAARFIRRAYNRMRCQDRPKRRLDGQVARGQTHDANGEMVPLDFPDPRQQEEWMKNMPLEVEEVLGRRSVRDRLVIELWLNGHTYEEIFMQVQAALPKVPISVPTVQRIIERFKDEMRGRLEEP